MKILFLSNFYPPASRGGFEQWCQEVADGLVGRGHEVTVLTSDYRHADMREPDPVWVHRDLHLEMEIASLRNALEFFTHRKRRENENLSVLKRCIEQIVPDIILIWGMWNLHRSVPALAERLMPGRVVYYMGDYWPTLPNQFENYWNALPRSPFTGIPKLLLKPFALGILAHEARPVLKLEHVLFPSVFMKNEFKQKGINPGNSKVIHGAIDTRPYVRDHEKRVDGTSLLYIGRLTREKGVHTAIEAFGQLVGEHRYEDLKLTIIGDGEPEYERYLHQLVEDKKIDSFVTFVHAQPKEELPGLYQEADVFLFTSIWPEPFGRVIVEAMASGLVVVGAPVGGAAEILVENVNALIYIPDDPASLARQLRRLIESPELRAQLIKAGRDTAVNQFDIRRMTAQIEDHLQTIVSK